MKSCRILIPVIAAVCLLGACAKEKPDPPRRTNPLDPSTVVTEPDPFLLTATLQGHAVSLDWQDPAMTGIDGWIVLRGDEESFLGPDTLATLDLGTTQYLDNDVVAGKTYYYKVLAKDSEGGISAGSHLAAVQIQTSPIILIDSDSLYAESRRVTLTIQASEADSMWISNNSTFDAGGWQPFLDTVADWLLETGAGTKTVYLRIRFADGTLSPAVADSISPRLISDTSIRSLDGTAYVLAQTDTIVVRATGADSIRVWNSGEAPTTTWSTFPASGDTIYVWSFPGGEGRKELLLETKNDFHIEGGRDTFLVAVDLSPPVAVFALSPPDSVRHFVADASSSYDSLDVTPSEDLLLSWQWEEGAEWTAWSREKTADHTYSVYGQKRIRLVVKDGAGRTDTSDCFVQAMNCAPSAPSAPTPADGSSGSTLVPRLSWTASTDMDDDPVTYTLYLGTDPDPATVLVSDWADTSCFTPPLESGGTYYWKVVAADTLGTASTTTVWSFTARTPSTENDYALALSIGSQGTGQGEMEVVRDVVVDEAGRISISDVNNRRVQVFAAPGVFVREITEISGTELSGPYGLAAGGDASLLVTDSNNHQVVKFDSSGTGVLSIGGYGSGQGQLQFPRDVCVDESGNIYVLDTGNYRVQKFDAGGAFVTEWGDRGDAAGQFDTPSGIAEAQGSVYVADSFNRRVQKFANDGQNPTILIEFPEGVGVLPRDVAVDSDGDVYVLDSEDGMVRKYGSDGTALAVWGWPDLGNPEGMWVDPSGDLVWVADTYNNRVVVFERQ